MEAPAIEGRQVLDTVLFRLFVIGEAAAAPPGGRRFNPVSPTRSKARFGGPLSLCPNFTYLDFVAVDRNEIGEAPARGRVPIDLSEVEGALSTSVGREIKFPDGSTSTAGPSTCPACGAADPLWGCDPEQQRPRAEIHPLVWHPDAWMADSYICRACDAGWIEPDDPEPITWVRPFWRL